MDIHDIVSEAYKIQKTYNMSKENIGINFPINKNKSVLVNLNDKHKINNIISSNLRYKKLKIIEPIFEIQNHNSYCTIVVLENNI